MIGKRMREYRKFREHKVKDFAKIIGISQGALSDIENGNSKPSADTLASLTRETDVNVIWLLTGDGPMLKGDVKEDIDEVTRRIFQLLEGMDEERKREILKHTDKPTP